MRKDFGTPGVTLCIGRKEQADLIPLGTVSECFPTVVEILKDKVLLVYRLKCTVSMLLKIQAEYRTGTLDTLDRP